LATPSGRCSEGFLPTRSAGGGCFFLNLPIAVTGVLVTYLVVKPDEVRKDHEGIDYLAMGVLTIGLFALVLALDLGTRMAGRRRGLLCSSPLPAWR
jgi:hypothetical protein